MTQYRFRIPLAVLIFLVGSVGSNVFAAMTFYSHIPNLLYSCLVFVILSAGPILTLFYIRNITYELDKEGLTVKTPIARKRFRYSEVRSLKKLGPMQSMLSNMIYSFRLKNLQRPALGFEIILNPEPIIVNTSQKGKTPIALNPENKTGFIRELRRKTKSRR